MLNRPRSHHEQMASDAGQLKKYPLTTEGKPHPFRQATSREHTIEECP